MRETKKIFIAGAGTMGYSMAEGFAEFGYQVTLYDIFDQALEKAKKMIALSQEIEITEGRLTREESEKVSSRIQYTKDKSAFAEADFVVEAILEKLEVKHEFWQEISQIVEEDVILCSNTSGISISQIAQVVKNPQRFCGMHWINPSHIIPLIEVVKGQETGEECIEAVMDLALKLGKKPVLVQDAPGFVLNRLQFAVVREALHIVEEGIATVEAVDDIMKYGLGLRYACLGPFQIADLAGLDIFYNISSYLFEDLADDKESFGLLKEHFEQKELGVKNGQGFYAYDNGKGEELIRYRDRNLTKVARALYEED